MGTFTTIPRSANKGCHGIEYVLVCDFADVSIVVDQSTGYATFESGDGDPSTAFTRFNPRKQTSGWDETGNGSAQSASNYYNQVVTLVFPVNDPSTRTNIYELSTSEVIVVVKERAGKNICLGSDNALDMNPASTTSGVGPGDLSGSTVVLSGDESYLHVYLTDSVLGGIQP